MQSLNFLPEEQELEQESLVSNLVFIRAVKKTSSHILTGSPGPITDNDVYDMIAGFYIESLHEENTMNRIPHLAVKIILKLAREIPLLALELLRKNLDNNSVIHRAIEVATSLRSEAIIGYNMRQDIQMGIFRSNFSFAIPSILAVNEICAFAGSEQILEVCSGLGLWASLIQANGGRIIPTDSFTSHGTNPYKTFLPVIDMDAVMAVNQFTTGVLMMSWPSYGDSFAVNALQAFKGDKFVYIGEGQGGCTANDDFFELLENEWDFDWDNRIDIPTWHHINDCICLYTRKPNVGKPEADKLEETDKLEEADKPEVQVPKQIDYSGESTEDSEGWTKVKGRRRPQVCKVDTYQTARVYHERKLRNWRKNTK
jgi:hypothetical protein